jgi:hypothetical protein
MEETPAEAAKTYIGTSSIVSQETLPNGLIRVTINDPQGLPPILDFTADQLYAVSSSKPYEDGEVSAKKWRLTVAKVVDMFIAENMEVGDRNYVMARIDEAIKSMYAKSVASKFSVDHIDRIALHDLIEGASV